MQCRISSFGLANSPAAHFSDEEGDLAEVSPATATGTANFAPTADSALLEQQPGNGASAARGSPAQGVACSVLTGGSPREVAGQPAVAGAIEAALRAQSRMVAHDSCAGGRSPTAARPPPLAPAAGAGPSGQALTLQQLLQSSQRSSEIVDAAAAGMFPRSLWHRQLHGFGPPPAPPPPPPSGRTLLNEGGERLAAWCTSCCSSSFDIYEVDALEHHAGAGRQRNGSAYAARAPRNRPDRLLGAAAWFWFPDVHAPYPRLTIASECRVP